MYEVNRYGVLFFSVSTPAVAWASHDKDHRPQPFNKNIGSKPNVRVGMAVDQGEQPGVDDLTPVLLDRLGDIFRVGIPVFGVPAKSSDTEATGLPPTFNGQDGVDRVRVQRCRSAKAGGAARTLIPTTNATDAPMVRTDRRTKSFPRVRDSPPPADLNLLFICEASESSKGTAKLAYARN